jgi:hypothetical protein
MNFRRWGQDEPNNYQQNEHCAEIWESTFNDKNCNVKLNFVCERPKGKTKITVLDGLKSKLQSGLTGLLGFFFK